MIRTLNNVILLRVLIDNYNCVVKLIVSLLFLFVTHCVQANELKEGYGTFSVPHKSCAERCKEFHLYKGVELILSGNTVAQEFVSLSGFQDAEYVIKFIGNDGKVNSSIYFNVKHYPLFESLIFFVLGFLLFCFLIISIRSSRE